ncbi:putative ABC transporter B family member 8 [Alnus glutinosa]|uniref:putative ABC transporter B family member 8 n=1 Tax=Alnus glutinosa TaxID=3517 RepID=UPI002D796F83|nr:putative ABC transporter B family member 8 [Alnus glutinosa]XP_062148337.1 putative ABC transporter B family member 8 [Alnus glutinosa]
MASPEKGGMRRKDKISIAIIFRYADGVDIMLMLLGTAGAIGDGMSTNCLLVFASRLMNNLGYGKTQQNRGNFMDEVEKCSLYFVYLGLAVMVAAFMEGYCWSKTSERQVLKIRYKYLEAVLRQEVGFFDSQEATTAEIINSISKDTSLIQEVLSEKAPKFLMHSSVFFSGLAFSTYFSWRLSLAAFPTLLVLIIPGMIYGKYLLYLSKKSYEEYNKSNTIIEQALSSIKTVLSFTAERIIVEKYSSILDRTTSLGIKQGIAKGLAVGSTGLSFAIWALLAWYGSHLVMYKGESGGRIYAAGISFILSGLSLGMALPDVKYFTEASVAATRIFDRINRVPLIDGENTKGIVLDNIRGEIEFEYVKFTYPSRPDSIVLKDFNLKIGAGKTVALVGASGSGKSTAIALVQRFYDADDGVVRIDGVDIKSLQLKWIRGKMGLVSQEHALFGTSIKDNIRFGKLDATMDEVTAAAMAANAHNFIRQLPEGYETKVGERGGLLSGGQKQRIAIARAIIKNPVILLLDEATSALDSESEALVQTALDQASMGRTTLVVAHKLSTVRNADLIAVVGGGCIIEIGSHNDLINQKNGHYAKLAKLQRQFSCDGQDQSSEVRVSSVARSSSSRLSTARSSPLFSKSPFTVDNLPPPVVSHPTPSFFRLLSLNTPEWKQALIGSLSAIAFGAVQPVYALTIGGMIAAFFAESHEEMRARIRTYSLIFSSLTLVSITMNLLQHYNFAYMGERLTKRIRLRMLEKILTFETAWFDEEQNSSGALCSRLSNEASMVKSLVADRVSLIVQTTSAVTIAMIMGLVVAWKLALVMIAVQPLTILCFYTRKVLLSSSSTNFVKAQNQSTQIAVEAVYNHRIVTSFGSVGKVLQLFDEAQEAPRKEARKKSWLAGIGMGSAQCLTFMSWALDFWYGGTLVEKREIAAGDVFKTFFILVSTGKVIADAGSMTSDLAKGATAVASVFKILDRQSLIPGSYIDGGDINRGRKLEKMSGRIEMKKVDFAYPSRPETLVLHQFSLEVKVGMSVGVVGKSGGGKSTVIGLIQRFYDVERGSVRVDGVDIRELDIQWYRRHTALVSQEPVIYAGTIRDNILFGKLDALENEVVDAARAANAHDFISSLKDGYGTECGERGVQLSGGQKQRIAIARAILRNPIVLLLDEATSALDVQSEQVVQEALDRIMVGRTTIVVAHRLNTIKQLDSIAVVANGKVAEQGTYAQLKSKRGAFFSLASLQTYQPLGKTI